MYYGPRFQATIRRPSNTKDSVGGFSPTYSVVAENVPCDYTVLPTGGEREYGISQRKIYKIFLLRHVPSVNISLGDLIEIYDGNGNVILSTPAEAVDFLPLSELFIVFSSEVLVL